MSVVLNSNGNTQLSKGNALTESKISLNSLSSYPSTLNMISNEIYLNTVSSLNNVLNNVEKMIEINGRTSPVLNLYEIDKMVNSMEKQNSKNVNFNESFSADADAETTEDNSQQTKIVARKHNNKMVRSFLRLLRPPISSKKRNSKDKKGSISTRSKFRSARAIGVLNNSEAADFRLRRNESIKKSKKKKSKSKASFSSGSQSTKSNKLKSTKRALSLLTRSAKFSTSASISSVSCSSPTNFNSSSILSTSNESSSSMSKELNWYRLEELDHYYKILGKKNAKTRKY